MAGWRAYCPDLNDPKYLIPLLLFFGIGIERDLDIQITPYRKYVRYRYPGEDWEQITADRYELKQDFSSEDGNIFDWVYLEFDANVNGRQPPLTDFRLVREDGEAITVNTIGTLPAPITNIEIFQSSRNWSVSFDYTVLSQNTCYRRRINRLLYLPNGQTADPRPSTFTQPGIKNVRNPRIVIDDSRSPIFCPNFQNSCNFTVYNCDEIVFQRESEDCPEVEIIDCFEEEESKRIIPVNLDRNDVFLVAEGKTGLLPPLLDSILSIGSLLIRGLTLNPSLLNRIALEGQQNPENCLLLIRINEFFNYDVIGQFCSDCDCPLPVYEVFCEPIEKCPDDTCKVDCGDHFCCYNDQGISVKSIAK